MTDDSIAPSPPPSDSTDAVQVAVRVRPLNAREKAAHLNPTLPSWQLSPSSITQCVNQKPVLANCFSFDHVFQPGIHNATVFNAIAKPVVASAIEGINGVIFAYGQTAAGKTYTMLGTPGDAGITPRSISHVFELIAQCTQRQFLLRASYIEIYNEVIRDLLVPSNDNLRIHEDMINKRVFVDAREEVVTAADDIMRIIAAGEEVRAVGETNMNDRSSRSHTIFTLKIESREITSADAEEDALSVQNEGVAIRASTLSLVDLAGSERASFTKAQGMRLVEGGHINKSLLTLGTVINKLSSGESRNISHIPYRDSKLTRLLQPALGGNARTAIICAITPSTLHMDETLSTLKFASRAKKVTNHAQTNEFLDDRAKLRRAEKKIASLQLEVQKLKSMVGVAANQSQPLLPAQVDHSERIRANEQKFDKLLAHLMQNALLPPEKAVETRRLSDMEMPASLRSALDLQVPYKSSSVCTAGEDGEHEQRLTEMRLKVMQAEGDRKRALLEIEFERRAMNDELGALVSASEQATRDRLVAERECDEALNALARSQAASLVDEIVTDAMNTSSLTHDLRDANRKLSVMGAIKKQNNELKAEVVTLQKELSEMRKREKRGVGPVMKEVRQEHSKRVEAETKLKGTRKQLQACKTEKACAIRDKNELERRMKTLTMENERHRNHTEKAQSRIEKAVSEAKKELQTALDEKEKGLSQALTDLSIVTDRRNVLEKQVTVLMETNAKLSSDLGARTDEKECAEERVVQLEDGIKGLQQRMQDMEAYSSDLTEQLGKVHLDLEEKKSELEDALRSRSETEKSELLAAKRAFAELEVRFLQGEKEVCSLKDSVKEGEADKVGLQDKLTVLVKEMAEYVATAENLRGKLKQCEEARDTADAEVASVRKEMGYEIEELQTCLQRCEEEKRMRGHGLEDNVKLRERIGELEVQIEDERSKWRELLEENEELRRKIGRLFLETETRMRELSEMASKLRSRDDKIFELEEEMGELSRGEGLIARLRSRISSKDMEIEDLRVQLRVGNEVLRERNLDGIYTDAEEFLKLKSSNKTLARDNAELQKKVDIMEKEKVELIQETYKLRKRIKLHDGERIESAIKRKIIEREHFHEECRRKKALREVDINSSVVNDSA